MATTKQLEALDAVAETGSAGAAAEELGVSRQAVHQALRSLEQSEGKKLTKADSTRGRKLTPAGEALLKVALPLLNR